MPGEIHELYPAVRLVREFVARSDDGRVPSGRRLPVLIFRGPAGTGKTALLDALEARLRGHVPYARLDFADTDATTTYDVLTKLAYALNHRCGMYGRLSFTYFTVGLIAMRATRVNLNIPSVAREQMKRALEEARKVPKLKGILGESAPELLFGRYFPRVRTLFKHLPELLVNLLTLSRWGRKVILGRGQAFYEDPNTDALDVLVDLNAWAQHPDVEGNKQKIGDLLLEAFLADLRRDFTKGRRAARRPLNCVVLLDNADTPLGSDFLEQLVRTREYAANDPDPITVVATGAPAPAMPDHETLSIRDPALVETEPPINRWIGAGRLTIELRDLTMKEVDTLVNGRGQRRGARLPPYVSVVIHDFTQGHVKSTNDLVGAFHGRRDGRAGLLDVLDGALDRRMLDDLLGEFPNVRFDALVTCAAARDRTELYRLGLADFDVNVIQEHWPALRGSADPAVMQPALRRLLLRSLAGRPDDDEYGWRKVHIRLREQADDDEGRLYHTLALDEVEPVARDLAGRLRELRHRPDGFDAGAWVAMLKRVTAAPVRRPVPEAPHRMVDRLTAWAPRDEVPLEPVARLVAGLRLAGDPLTGPDRRSLHQYIYLAYGALKRYGTDVFEKEEERHKEMARLWLLSEERGE